MPGTGRSETFGLTRCLSVISLFLRLYRQLHCVIASTNRSDQFLLLKQVLHGIQCDHAKNVNRHVYITTYLQYNCLHYTYYIIYSIWCSCLTHPTFLSKWHSGWEFLVYGKDLTMQIGNSLFLERKTPYSHLWPVYFEHISHLNISWISLYACT